MHTLKRSLAPLASLVVILVACGSKVDTGDATPGSQGPPTAASEPSSTASPDSSRFLPPASALSDEASAIANFREALGRSPVLATIDVATPTIELLKWTAGSVVTAQLLSAEPIDFPLTTQVACESSDGTRTGQQCDETVTFAVVRYLFQPVTAAAFGDLPDVSALIKDTFTIDIAVGITKTNRPDIDAATTEDARALIVRSAPRGMTFAMYLNSRSGPISLALWNAWAVAESNGALHSLFIEPGTPTTEPTKDWVDDVKSLEGFLAQGRGL